MEQPAPALRADPAPALTRGLQILRLLERDGAASLERLAGVTGWPKSSVLRLLQSLEAGRFVSRDPIDKRYVPLVRLLPVGSGEAALIGRARSATARLCQATGQTVELHRYRDGTLTMIDRREPENSPVRVVARIGFQRRLDEIDALTQVAAAFGRAKLPERCWAWRRGRRSPLTPQRVRRLIAEAGRHGVGIDVDENIHGIRRYAVPVLNADHVLEAVLAVAQSHSPSRRGPDAAVIEALLAAGRQV